MAMNVQEKDSTDSWMNTQSLGQEMVEPVPPAQRVQLEPTSDFLSFSTTAPPFSRNRTMIHNSDTNNNYFENTPVNSQRFNVPHSPHTKMSLPNPNINTETATWDQFIQLKPFDNE